MRAFARNLEIPRKCRHVLEARNGSKPCFSWTENESVCCGYCRQIHRCVASQKCYLQQWPIKRQFCTQLKRPQLKQQRDKLKQYQKRILNNLESERKLAKQLLQDGRKEKAKLLLRKKKFMEQMITKTDGQLINLEQMCHDIEFAQIEHQVLEGLKVGNESLKSLHEMLSIDDIERIMDETREGIEKQQEIDEILGGKLTDEDEAAVMDELESIIAESLPTPVQEPVAGKDEEEPEEDEELDLPEIPTEEPKQKVRRKEAPQLVAAS